MAEKYVMGKNPIRDYLFNLMTMGADISDENMGDSVYNSIIYILEHTGVPEQDLKYLDFSIVRERDEYYKVIPENIVTALWFSFKFPINCDITYNNNKTNINGIEYTFNNNKLTWKKISQ